tara:strand:+ start:258 stop:518 length:261 start_codon:yes stop_codon:yes gene_type:complete
MPKYVYKCNECEEHFEIYHGMMESQDQCVFCSAEQPIRVPQMPFIKRKERPKGKRVGDEVKAAIEANRAILEQSKEQSKNSWEPDK